MSEDDFAMLQGNLAGVDVSQQAPRSRKSKADLPENRVESQIVDYLRYRGWIVTRRHVGKVVPLGLLLGYLNKGKLTRDSILRNIIDLGNRSAADWHAERVISRYHHQVLDVEVKAPGKRPDADQLKWIRDRNLTHCPATWADSLESFHAWYCAQGWGGV